ncbi:hypothetical protein [Methylophilus sp.]|uniref:hypothetical protein n=1 Tax=Methylophilus sp. TaxID=29541 RepID=UPI000D46D496|nr:hypothetical protein [Methylophilus sp.]PPD12171.1 MAG: hypothetical protein CTY26_06155 [Methylophilus sp.]
MSAIDDLTTVPAQPEISEGNKTFSQKTYALYVWIRTKLVPAMVELRDLIVNSVTGAFSGTSNSTVTITDTGEVSITTDTGRSFKPGTPVRLAYVTDPLKYIDGITKTYNSSTGALVFYALAKAGSGEYSNWSLTIIPSGGGLAGLGSNTFVDAQYVPDDAYDAGTWNGSTAVPTKNAIRNKIESILSTIIPASESEAKLGANNVKYMTALSTRQAYPIRTLMTAWSAAYTPAGGETLSAAHGQSVVPYSVQLVLECISADLGYSVGDRVTPHGFWNGSATNAISYYADATNVGVKCPTGFIVYIQSKTTGSGTTPAAGKWKYAFEFKV